MSANPQPESRAAASPSPPAVCLRPVTAADSADLYRWRMDDSARPMFRQTERVPFAAHERFLARHLAGGHAERWYVIEADGAPVGAIALYDVSPDGAEAEWGRFVIDAAQRHRGIGRTALAQLIDVARDLGIARLRCEVLAGNHAERLYRRLGFVAVDEEVAGGRRFVRMIRELGAR